MSEAIAVAHTQTAQQHLFAHLRRIMVAKLLGQFKSPLVLNGYALVFSSGATSVLGFGYWILVARLYTEEAVGLNSAVLSAMFFLANVSQLNLAHALNRFVPAAGSQTQGLVLKSYLLSVVMAVVASVVFLVGLEVWTPSLSGLRSSPAESIWFIFATVSWCLFVLQDSVLVGLRQAKWVPLENIVYALVKLVLVIFLATALPENGVFVSWTAPILLLTLPVNAFIFFWLIPTHARAASPHTKAINTGAMVRYVAGDYFSSLIWTATVALVPLLILERLGASASAHFYLAWNITYALYLVSVNMGMSLVAEGSRDEVNLELYSYQTLKQILRLVVPAVTLIVVGAPLILQLYGENYAAEGSALLRLLSLSAIPYAVVFVYVSMVRVQRRIRKVFFVFAALCTLVLVSAYLFSSAYGVTGVGLAWLVGQSAVALTLLLTDLRRAWLPHLEVPRPARALLRFSRNGPAQLHLRRARKLLPAVTEALVESGHAGAHSWELQRLLPTLGDTKVMTLGPGGREVAVFKLPVSLEAAANLVRQAEVLAALRKDVPMADWSTPLPSLLAEARAFPHAYLVEAKLPGVRAEVLLLDPATRGLALENAAQAIGGLHRRTAEYARVDEALVAHWVDAPLRAITDLLGNGTQRSRTHQLALELKGALLGRTVALSWVHGDYSPQNVLMGKDAEVTGIVGWELAVPRQLPVLDVIHFIVATRMLVERRELGSVLCTLLTEAALSAAEGPLIEAATSPEHPPLELRTVLLLSWLRHIHGSVKRNRHTFAANNPLWLAKNVKSVLNCAALPLRR